MMPLSLTSCHACRYAMKRHFARSSTPACPGSTAPHSEALEVSGVSGVEKTCARKTGLQYHVELHLEVDPQMTVQDSHELATATRFLIREKLDWVADVVVHIEPFPGGLRNQ
jgi:divalent metal cation (Fe/Co/Zn/Cd) transporter